MRRGAGIPAFVAVVTAGLVCAAAESALGGGLPVQETESGTKVTLETEIEEIAAARPWAPAKILLYGPKKRALGECAGPFHIDLRGESNEILPVPEGKTLPLALEVIGITSATTIHRSGYCKSDQAIDVNAFEIRSGRSHYVFYLTASEAPCPPSATICSGAGTDYRKLTVKQMNGKTEVKRSNQIGVDVSY